jgi:hypothetical protein
MGTVCKSDLKHLFNNHINYEKSITSGQLKTFF